ncbi:hypothetical protein ACET3Z_025295 [Daucus carota]
MIRIGPAYPGRGIPWDHKGKTEVAQILISCNRNRINFMYFVYVEDGGTKLVLSEKIGREETSHSMETVNFDYPSEYITRVSGQYNDYLGKYLRSITFHTNKGVYGPFAPGAPGAPTKGLVSIDFNYQVAGKFGGFFGSYETDSIETIGFYIDPLQKLANQPGEIAVGGSDGLEASGQTS